MKEDHINGTGNVSETRRKCIITQLIIMQKIHLV